ncbi:Dpy-30 motif protein [Ophiocordyceps camponoti-floridani]|uniref:Dpy-30 motif protein n=1 Tax=Ophiocordyceps camponoti-floridani TaxID=2030778 RepID=A0A8H4Q6Q7_9HYPO|nr:Dpy-30 motif protein [Ophiocordyceps camponoti-floridani]
MAGIAPKAETPLETAQAPTASVAMSHPSTDTAAAKDVVMSDAPPDQAAADHSSAPARTGTPAQGSRAASVHPDAGSTMPSEAAPHGDPTRRYLNTKVTASLLEGMKQLAKDQPQDPLRVLGEFLLQKSKELERTGQV